MLKEWLLQFVAGGGTVFMTSHVLERVERLCTRAAILRSGKIVWHGALGVAARGGQLTAEGRASSLEELFVALVGRERHGLAWL
jgi:ABC-2 type transport system ATP-binding protein